MIVWDQGSYENLNDVSMAEALDCGEASFRLEGEKLRGAFTLVRTDAGSPSGCSSSNATTPPTAKARSAPGPSRS